MSLFLPGDYPRSGYTLRSSHLVPSEYGTKFACGEFNETQNRMIVTKGLGTSILNVRFGTFPEIVVIEDGHVKKQGSREEILPEILGTSSARKIACEKLGGNING